MSLYDELILLLYKEIKLQLHKDSRRSTSRYVYTLSGFLLFLSQQKKPFGLWVVPLAISLTKVLLEEETHKEEVLPYYEIVQGGDMTKEHNLSIVPSLLLRIVGVYWD